MAQTKARRHDPAQDISPPGTVPFTGDLLDGADCEAMDFRGLILGPASAKGAAFLGCRLERCSLDEVRLDGARLAECRLSDLAATAIQATDTSWRDTLVAGLRVGAFMAAGSTWDLVRLRGVKANLLDLRGARLRDVDLVGARLGIVRGITGLRGATLSPGQLLDLAPQLAADVGILVRD